MQLSKHTTISGVLVNRVGEIDHLDPSRKREIYATVTMGYPVFHWMVNSCTGTIEMAWVDTGDGKINIDTIDPDAYVLGITYMIDHQRVERLHKIDGTNLGLYRVDLIDSIEVTGSARRGTKETIKLYIVDEDTLQVKTRIETAATNIPTLSALADSSTNVNLTVTSNPKE